MRRVLVLLMVLMLALGTVLALSSCGDPDRGGQPGTVTETEQPSAGSANKPQLSGNSLNVPAVDPGRRGTFAAMVRGADALKNNAGKDDSQLLWYADECWYVIGYDGSGSAAARGGAITLLHSDVTGTVNFSSDPGSGDSNAYSGSALQGSMDALLAKGSNARFHSREQTAVIGRELRGGNVNYGEDGYDGSLIKGGSIVAIVWPLWSAAAESLPASVARSESGTAWWLSSPGETDSNAQYVGSDGSVSTSGTTVTETLGSRPAFDLDTSAILFASSAEGGKASGSAGPDALAEVGRNDSGHWKVTLKDDGTNPQLSGHAGFSVDSTASCDGKTLKIQYSGAQTGSNEFISAVLIDSGGSIRYYGRIAQASSSSGAVNVNIDGKLKDGFTLYLFNEQYNGDRTTDYSSALKEIAIPADPHHTWVDATCTEPSRCTTCGETRGEPFGHDWKDATCTEPKTCARCGATEGSALGHNWEIKSCTEPRYCTRCGAAEAQPVGHDWKDATCTEPKTCARCGATEGTALGHDWKDVTCTEPRTCVRCKKKEGEPLGHKWDGGKVTKEPTCEEAGVKTITCLNDPSHTQTEEIKALGHNWGAWEVTKEAEVGIEGVEERKCERCGIKEARAIPALKEFKVTFDTMGGPEIPSQMVVENKAAVKPADPARENFSFAGWFTDSECTSPFDFSKAITSDTTVYAGWIEMGPPIPPPTPVYTISDGGEGKWTKGSGGSYEVIVERSVDAETCFDHYSETLIDGKKADVSSDAGTRAVEISAETLEKLSAGTHTITVRFDDGEAQVTLEIIEAEVPPAPDPDEGGSSGMKWLILIPVVILGVGAGFLIGRKRSK